MSVGSALSEARVRAGLSLDDVSDRTRIRRTLVDNIEHDDFHSCGGDFYARGHVKSIAQTLHIDPAPLLAEFDGGHQHDDALIADGVLDHAHTHDDLGARRRPNWTAFMAVALLVLVAFGAFRVVSRTGSGTSTGGADAALAASPRAAGPSTVASNPTPSVPAVGSVPSGPVVVPAGVTVKVRAVGGPSWVSATARDGRVLFQQLMSVGQQQTLRNDRLVKLLIGNAGAVDVRVNGTDLGSPGAQGEVVHLSFGPGIPSATGG